jgi:predicted transcriptional regulator
MIGLMNMLKSDLIKPKRKIAEARPNQILKITRPPKKLPMVLLELSSGKKSRTELLRKLDISTSGLENVVAYMVHKGMIIKVPDDPNQPKAGMSYQLGEVNVQFINQGELNVCQRKIAKLEKKLDETKQAYNATLTYALDGGLSTCDAVLFLQMWNEGCFPEIRTEFDNVPDEVFISQGEE